MIVIGVEQKSRADFAPEIKLPLSKLTATDNIMLGKQALQCLAMLSNAEQYLAIFLIYMDLCCAETKTFFQRDDLVYSYTQ
jgi:hypothetical protein